MKRFPLRLVASHASLIRVGLALTILTLADSSPAQTGPATQLSTPAQLAPANEQAKPPLSIQIRPNAEKPKVIPEVRVRTGPLVSAVEQLTHMLELEALPSMNIIYSPEARALQVPDLVLRNVNGPDALRLLAVSAGCDLETIPGKDDEPIGYRLFHVNVPARGAGGLTEFGGFGGDVSPAAPPPGFARFWGPEVPAGGMPGNLGGGAGLTPGPAPGHGASAGGSGISSVINFAGMPSANASCVRVYSFGAITNVTKFAEVEATLRDILKMDGVPADAAKIGFHEKTNVLVVNAEPRVHELVTQFLEALQKNVAAASSENNRHDRGRLEVVEAMVRLEAEKEQRMKLMKQLEETETAFRETQRELDRIKQVAPKAP